MPETLALYRMLIGEIGRFPQLGQAFYDHGPRQEIADIEGVLSGLMPPQQARARAEAFFSLTMGHAYHQFPLGCLPEELRVRAFEAQIREAVGLVFPGSPSQ